MPIASNIAATQAANFSDNHNASISKSFFYFPTRFIRALNISALILFVSLFLWEFKTIFCQGGTPCYILHKIQKRERGILVFGIFQENRSLLKRRMHLCRYFPSFPIA